MTDLPTPVKVLPIVIGMIALVIVAGVGRIKNQGAEKPGPSAASSLSQSAEIPPCSGSAVGHAPSLKPHQHSVTLSWNAAVSASQSRRDAIQGYYVYRSLT